MGQEIALDIENYSYSYPSDWLGKSKPAVQNLSLTVYEGESFGFLGHNGAGKTTTIKSILGLTIPTTGTIRVFDHNHTSSAARSILGYLPEQPYFYDHLTVRELVEMFAHLSNIPSGEVRSSVDLAMKRVNIDTRAKAKLGSLSKGLIQRAALAQAIVHKPKLLVLDEPFSGLDPVGRSEFKNLFNELKEEGVTIFASSHILEDIEFLCDRASIMVGGELKLVLDLDNLSNHTNREFEVVLQKPISDQFIASSGAGRFLDKESTFSLFYSSSDSAQECLKKAIDSGVKLSSFDTTNATLEDVFVDLVKNG